MDKIVLKDLQFLCRLGITDEERAKPQTVLIDIVMQCDLHPAAISDDINDTVNYHVVYERVKALAEEKSFNLIEALAEEIAAHILVVEKKIRTVEVSVKKINPPIEGQYKYFGVSIERTRDD